MHRILEDEFEVGVPTEALRRRLIKDFDYTFSQIPYDTASVKFQTRRFLLQYSDTLQSQLRGEIEVAYMDETQVWRYHSTKKGIAPVGITHRNIKSGKSESLIVVDAITEDGPLRCKGAEMTASDNGYISSENSGHGGNECMKATTRPLCGASWRGRCAPICSTCAGLPTKDRSWKILRR